MKHALTTLAGIMHSCADWHRGRVGMALTILAALAWVGPAIAPLAHGAPQAAPSEDELDLMPLDEVRSGMTGYGLTVFQGTEIEPFSVEVLSVAHAYGPQRSVIWIHSEDPRMLESGPVQGMSGSPIYLWDEGEAGEPGDGQGRLIGAFAFGFTMAKGAIVGVQPVEYMLEVGDRAHKETAEARDLEAGAGEPGDTESARRTLGTLARMAQRSGPQNPVRVPRLDAFRALLEPAKLERESGGEGEPGRTVRAARAPSAADSLPPAPAGKDEQGEVVPMLLPMSVGSSDLARLTRPLLEPMGISPVSGGGGTSIAAGAPPHGIDRDAVEFAPGSVMSVPLAFGDLDLAAAGTVTEVLADGSVLGLGHAMFGEGPTALPMATGHVHFIVPRLNISFKLSGSLDIKGSLVRDEQAGVVGRGDTDAFVTSPVEVNVEMPGHEARTYSYQVVDHHQLTPTLAAIVTLRSIEAKHMPPRETTLNLRGQMRFRGGHTVELDTMMPGDEVFGALSELLPPLALAMQNPHEGLKLDSMDVTAEIAPGRRTAEIVDARLDRTRVAPGERVGVTVWVQPYKEAPRRLRAELEIPAHVPEGDYPLMISDARTYLSQLMAMRPHLFTTRDIDDLMQMIQRILSVRRDAVHLTMHMPEEGIAVGRQELSQLPSSRRAMIFTPSSTLAQPYMEMLEQTIETDLGISGQAAFTVHVREQHTESQPAGRRRGR